MSMSKSGRSIYANPSTLAMTPAEYNALVPDEPTVTLRFLRVAMVTLSDGRMVKIPAGTHEIAESLANHPYVIAHKPESSATPPAEVPHSDAPFSPLNAHIIAAPKEADDNPTDHEETGAGDGEAEGSADDGTAEAGSEDKPADEATHTITLTGGENKPKPRNQRVKR